MNSPIGFTTIKEHLDSATSICATFRVPLADIPALWRIGPQKALQPFSRAPDFKQNGVHMKILPDILKSGGFSLNHVQVTGDGDKNHKISFFWQKIGAVIRHRTFGDLLQAERLVATLSNRQYELHVYLDSTEVRFHCK
jgi:hypothetical protein